MPSTSRGGGRTADVESLAVQFDAAGGTFPTWVRDAYVDALRDPAHAHANCEEYRAAAGIDGEIDEADLSAGRRITCLLLALWSSRGCLARR